VPLANGCRTSNKGTLTESNRRFKVMKHHLGDMLMSNHQVHNFMGAHFWSELPDVTSYSYGEAEAMSDEWKIHLLMDVLKRHWAETKSTAGVEVVPWQAGTPQGMF